MPRTTAPVALCLLLSTVGIGACLSLSAHDPAEGSPASAYAEDPAALKRGRSIFIGTCAGYCHRFRGGSAGDIPYLFDCDWRHGGRDEEVFASIYRGFPGTPMIAFGGKLEDEDLWKVVAFLRAASRCESD